MAAPRGRKAGYHYHLERQAGVEARERLAIKRLIWVHRPIWLHATNTTGGKCPCCDSDNAIRVRSLRHIDLIIDRETGTRLLRAHGDDPDFDALAAEAERIDCPARVYDKQLPILLDRESKVIGVFGGTQGGKSAVEAEWILDQMLERGGAGAQFWWVGPDAKQAFSIGNGKLVTGQKTDRWSPGLIPSALIVSGPTSTKQAEDTPVRLLDGTVLWFKHAHKTDATNLKGEPCQAIVLDEGCAVRHEVNWDELLSRLTTTGGQLLTASTPVLGNFLHDRVYKVGATYEQIAANDTVYTGTAIANLTVFDNPWQSPANIAAYVASFGTDTLRLRLQAYGEWVTVGTRMWHTFDKAVHVVEGASSEISGYGCRNITPKVAARFFTKSSAVLDHVGGQDFNLRPMNLADVQIGCPHGLDESNPDHWVVFVRDLIARDGDVVSWAEWLRDKAGGRHGRGRAPDAFRGMAIACDASRGHANKGPQSGEDPYIREMRRAGFDARACHVSQTGKPINPTIPQRTTVMHRLMADRIALPGGGTMPRLIVHGTYADELVRSLELQTATPDGQPYKVSNTRSDKISGPIDALGYVVWALIGAIDQQRSRVISSSLNRRTA